MSETELINYRSIRLSEITVKRLQEKAARYRDSYDTIINRILDEREGKETSPQGGAFRNVFGNYG